MEKKITIKDIARELNIHHTTVSRALRGDFRIKEETKSKIVAYAKEKGYRVNQGALNFRNKQSNEIALLVPNISHYTFSNFISRVSDLAQENGFVVSVFQSKENYENEKEILKIIMQNRVAGVIASISNSTIDTSHFRQLIDFGVPLVFFDRVCQDIDTSKVMIDNFKAAFEAVQFFISKGYCRIGHITGPSHINVFSDRHKGYLSALEKSGLDYKLRYEVSKEFEIADGFNAMKKIWSYAEKPDALLCDSFTLSAGVNSFCNQNGIIIPGDVAIIAVANDPFSGLLNPPQTVMEQPIGELATTSFDLLMNAISSKNKSIAEVIYHKARLIKRESV
ncbi:MAG: LacI family DNA-binding transcriptional regulator [Marinilabiliaceae bacterium]|nr:LacI family DNA-binding transcriptional regulator [Marinilabiliaceae bacterium]